MPNTFITTHSGAGTGEADANCADMAISELKDYLENGNIAHSVNYPTCSMGKARAASRIACLHANVPNMIGQITAILDRLGRGEVAAKPAELALSQGGVDGVFVDDGLSRVVDEHGVGCLQIDLLGADHTDGVGLAGRRHR